MRLSTAFALVGLATIGACSFPPITFSDANGSGTTTNTSSAGGGGASTTTGSTTGAGGQGAGGSGAGGAPAATTSTSGNGGAGGVNCDVKDKDGDAHDATECGGDDCDDNDKLTHPGQTDYFSSPRNGGGYDYNCDGDETPEFQTVPCTKGNECPTMVFVNTTAIECGQPGAFGDCNVGIPGVTCSPPSSTQIKNQPCH